MGVSSNIFAVLSNAAADGTVELPSNNQKQNKKQQQNNNRIPVVPAPDRATQNERFNRGTGYPARGGARRVVGARTSGGQAEGYQPKSDNRSRGPRNQHVAPRRGRQFDRHSGTGMVDSEKKEKQGWLGDENALVEDGDKATEQAKKDQKQEGAEGSPEPVAAEEVEPEVVTLDDYLKQQEAASGAGEQKALRKANEGTIDNSQMKGGSVAYAKEDEDFFSPVQLQKSQKQKGRKEKKTHVEIKQIFADDQPRRGAFRGGPRDRNQPRHGGRGGARQTRASVVSVKDERAFPSL